MACLKMQAHILFERTMLLLLQTVLKCKRTTGLNVSCFKVQYLLIAVALVENEKQCHAKTCAGNGFASCVLF